MPVRDFTISAYRDRASELASGECQLPVLLAFGWCSSGKSNPGRTLAPRRVGYAHKFAIQEGDRLTIADPDILLDIDAVLTRLSAEDLASAEVARFRIFAGLSIDEAANALGLFRATAFREWAYTRSWLKTALTAKTDSDAPLHES